MNKTLLTYILKITDHNTLAQIYVSFSNGEWPAAIPNKYKPVWFYAVLIAQRKIYTLTIQDYIRAAVPAHTIEWWKNLHDKYNNNPKVKEDKIYLPKLSELK